MNELEVIRKEMIEHLARIGIPKFTSIENKQKCYEESLKSYDKMTTTDIFKEYGYERYKEGQDSYQF